MKKKQSKEKKATKKIPAPEKGKVREPIEEKEEIKDPAVLAHALGEEEVEEIIPKVLSGDEELDPLEAADKDEEDDEGTYNPIDDYEDGDKGF